MTVQRAFHSWMRRLRRNTSLVAFVVISLGLPLGAGIMALSLNASTLWRGLPFPESDQLVAIEARSTTSEPRWLSLPELDALATQSPPPYGAIAGYTVADLSVTAEGAIPAEGLLGTLASAEFFGLLGITPQMGSLPEASAYSAGGERVVLLSHDFWQRRYAGDAAIVGRVIRLSAIDYFRGVTGSYRVVGILPRDLWLFSKRADVVVPMRVDAEQAADPNSEVVEHVVARLRNDWPLDGARAASTILLSRLRSAGARAAVGSVSIDSLMNAHYRAQKRPLQSVLLIAAVVLLLATANLVIAALADAIARRRETAVRIALGGTPARLLVETISETSITVACAGLLGVMAGMWLTRIVAAAAPAPWIARVPGGAGAIRLDAEVAVTFAGVAVAIVLMTSVLIQRAGRAQSPWSLIASSASAFAPHSTRLRSALVSIELALAVCAMGIGLVLMGQLSTLRSTDLGVQDERAAAAWINPDTSIFKTPAVRSEYYESLVAAVRAQPGIEAAGAVDLPFHFAWEPTVVRRGSDSDATTVQALSRAATPGYLEAIGIRLLDGRWFGDHDRSGAPPVVAISHALARSLWPDGGSVGQSLLADAKDPASAATVIGVVSDTRHAPHLPPDRTVYRAIPQAAPSSIYVIAKGHPGMDAGLLIAQAVWSVHRNQPVDGPWDVRKWVADRTADLQFVALVSGVLAIVGGLIAAAGLYAVTSHWVIESARDIGVRRAIGASSLHIARWFGSRLAWIVVPGMAGGLLLVMGAFQLVVARIEAVAVPTGVQLAGVGFAVVVCMTLAAAPSFRRAVTTDAKTLTRDS